jgi:uroporphyrinogen decarboxylase
LKPDAVLGHLAPVLETLERVKAELAPEKTLLGFCGSPWTVATYMIGGRGTPDQAAGRVFALTQPEAMARLIDILVEASAAYLVAQLRAGADAVQLFESWALNLDEHLFAQWVIEPNRRVAEAVRREVPGAAIIGFPRGAAAMIPAYVAEVKPDALGLDYMMPVWTAAGTVKAGLPVQGNLDPLRLLAGGTQMEERTEEIIAAFADRPHIFNLGHGIVPETPIAHVERLIEIVKRGR